VQALEFNHDDVARFSNRHDSRERDVMPEGILVLQRSLAEAAFAHR
jgi:hypothetical protein